MKRSMLVRDYMVESPLTFEPGMDILSAAHALIKRGVGSAPVLDINGWPIGIITEQDCIAVALLSDDHFTPGGIVSDRMTANPKTVGADDSIFDAAQKFVKNKFHGYPVVTDDGYLVGLLRRSDVLRAMGEFYPR